MEQAMQAIQDSLRSAESVSTAYDSIWGGTNLPAAPPSPLEQVMLSNDKLYVVLAVVLIIWLGVIFFILRTDRRISDLERSIGDRIHEKDDEL